MNKAIPRERFQMQNNHYLFDLNYDDLLKLCKTWGEPDYRVDQIWSGLYQHLWSSLDDFTTLPKGLNKNWVNHFLIMCL